MSLTSSSFPFFSEANGFEDKLSLPVNSPLLKRTLLDDVFSDEICFEFSSTYERSWNRAIGDLPLTSSKGFFSLLTIGSSVL